MSKNLNNQEKDRRVDTAARSFVHQYELEAALGCAIDTSAYIRLACDFPGHVLLEAARRGAATNDAVRSPQAYLRGIAQNVWDDERATVERAVVRWARRRRMPLTSEDREILVAAGINVGLKALSKAIGSTGFTNGGTVADVVAALGETTA